MAAARRSHVLNVAAEDSVAPTILPRMPLNLQISPGKAVSKRDSILFLTGEQKSKWATAMMRWPILLSFVSCLDDFEDTYDFISSLDCLFILVPVLAHLMVNQGDVNVRVVDAIDRELYLKASADFIGFAC